MGNDYVIGRFIQKIFDKMSVNCKYHENEDKKCLYNGRPGKPCTYKNCPVIK